MTRAYQTPIAINNLYAVRLKSLNGLGETLKPRYIATGGTVALYISDVEPTGVTQANIATKMSLVSSFNFNESFNTVPNFIAFIQDSGAVTSLILSSLEIEQTTAIPA